MKAFLKLLLVLILIPVILVVVFYFVEGGYGKKEPVFLPLKNPDMPLLFAHRGVVTGKYPENSREAIEQAKKAGFRALEIDIRKTADNRLILFHDAEARRLLGIDTVISAIPLDEIMKHTLLINKDTTASKVILLDDMLKQYKGDFIFYFDMKLGGLADIDHLVRVIWSHDVARKVIVASPSVAVILYIEYQYPAIQTAMEGFNSGNEWSWYLIPQKLKPDFLSGFAQKVDQKHIDWLKKNELLNNRIVYGVDSTNYQQMVNYGIKNMIIDYWPGLQVQ